jgi:hypothetical protein
MTDRALAARFEQAAWLPTAPQGKVTQAGHEYVAKLDGSSPDVTNTVRFGEAGQA